MNKILEIALGVLVAMGGFIDIGDFVFATQSGAKFGYDLLWALALGVVGIIVYAEMSGRVAMITKKPVFSIIQDMYPVKLGWLTLIISLLLCVLTCAAEIGGIALALQLLSGFSYPLLIITALLALIIVVWILPFQGIERIFGYVGLGLLAFVVAALKLNPDWESAWQGLVPHVASSGNLWSYFYFAVGIIAATFMPYEIYFYSSGVIEEKWKPKEDMIVNKANSIFGFLLGGLVVAGIIIASAELLRPFGINPELIGTPILDVMASVGKVAAVLAIVGLTFSIAGAAIETSFSGAYNLSQFLGWDWGKHKDPMSVPKFTKSWLLIFVIAAGIIMTGVDPIKLTEYAVMFSVVAMPLTFWPIFKVARNEELMGKYTNKWLANTLGWVYFVVICIVSVSAVPLMFISNQGQL